MSLPSIKELLVDLKDLGNVVHDIKGSFPFSLNEKQEVSFDQEWMDIDSAFFGDLEKRELLKYSEEETVAEGKNPEDVNDLLENAPTALGDVAGNEFRKGIEGVYRLMNDFKPVFSKVESAGLDYVTNTKFNDVTFASMDIFVPVIETVLNQAFQGALVAAQAPVNLANPVVNAAVNAVANPVINAAVNVAVNAVVNAAANPATATKQAKAIVTPANAANVADDAADNAFTISHRNHYPQKVILPQTDVLGGIEDADIARLFDELKDKVSTADLEAALSDDDVIDDEAIQALMDDLEIPSEDAQPEVEIVNQTPPALLPRDKVATNVNPVVADEEIADEEAVDEAAIRALLEDFNVNTDDLTVDLLPPPVPTRDDEVTEEEAASDLAPELPPREEAQAESNDDELDSDDEYRSADDLDSDEEQLASDVDAPQVDFLTSLANALKGLVGLTSEVAPEASDEEILAKAGITIEEAVDVDVPVTVEEFPSVDTSAEDIVLTTAETQAEDKPVVAEDEPVVAEDKPVAEVEESLAEQVVNMDAINELLGEVGVGLESMSAPANIPLPPPMPGNVPLPPPMPVKGSIASTKLAKDTEAATPESAPKASAKPAMPAFAIGAEEFAKQRDLIKARAAEKAAAKAQEEVSEPATKRQPSSLLEEALSKAFDTRPSSKVLQVEETSTSASSTSELDEWELEQLQEDNTALIESQVRAKALTFDLNGLVNQLIVTKQAAITTLVDAYEQKLHTLPCVTKLSAENQDNVHLANGIITATNKMQQKVVESIKTHAMSVALGVIQADLTEQMKIKFPVKTLQVDIDRQDLDQALTDALQKVDDSVLESAKADAIKGMDQILASDAAYLETNKQPSMFDLHCKNGVDAIAKAFEQDKQALVKIIETEGLEPVVKAPAISGESGGGMFDFLAGKLKGIRGDLDGNNDDDYDSDSDEPAQQPVEVDKTHTSSPFGFQALKNLLGAKLGGQSDSDKSKDADDSDDSDQVDHDAIDSFMGVLSPVSSGYLSTADNHSESDVDQDAIDDLLGMVSPVNSGYLETGPVISQGDVLQGGGIIDTATLAISHHESEGPASPVVMQQLTQIQESQTGDIFSPF